MIEVLAEAQGRTVRAFLVPDTTRRVPRDASRFTVSARNLDGVVHNPLAHDMLVIAAAVHLSDRCIRRSMKAGARQRRFKLTIPVRKVSVWNRCSTLLEELASFATQDEWRLEFCRHEPIPIRTAAMAADKDGDRAPNLHPTIVSLCSGGLDSLCGAAYLAERGEVPVFVTHSPPGQDYVSGMTNEVFRRKGRPPLRVEQFVSFAVRPHLRDSAGRLSFFPEPTRRSRPFFFLGLTGAAALTHDIRRIQMSENGALAMSLPQRRGSHGPRIARQAHVFLLKGFERLLNIVSPGDPPWSFENPFTFLTKGEACRTYLGSTGSLAKRTTSCEYAGQQMARLREWTGHRRNLGMGVNAASQCGLCVPCLVRRAALHYAGIADPDSRYAFSASRSLEAIRKGRAYSAGKGAIPLYDFIASHCFYFDRYAGGIINMNIDDFAVEYLPELLPMSSIIERPNGIAELFKLQQRFGREMLEFLNA